MKLCGRGRNGVVVEKNGIRSNGEVVENKEMEKNHFLFSFSLCLFESFPGRVTSAQLTLCL